MDKDRKWFPDEQGAGMIPFELREGFGGRHAFSQEIIDEIRKTEPEFGKIIGIDTARFSVSGPERNGVIIPARDPDSAAYKDMRHFLDAGGDERFCSDNIANGSMRIYKQYASDRHSVTVDGQRFGVANLVTFELRLKDEEQPRRSSYIVDDAGVARGRLITPNPIAFGSLDKGKINCLDRTDSSNRGHFQLFDRKGAGYRERFLSKAERRLPAFFKEMNAEIVKGAKSREGYLKGLEEYFQEKRDYDRSLYEKAEKAREIDGADVLKAEQGFRENVSELRSLTDAGAEGGLLKCIAGYRKFADAIKRTEPERMCRNVEKLKGEYEKSQQSLEGIKRERKEYSAEMSERGGKKMPEEERFSRLCILESGRASLTVRIPAGYREEESGELKEIDEKLKRGADTYKEIHKEQLEALGRPGYKEEVYREVRQWVLSPDAGQILDKAKELIDKSGREGRELSSLDVVKIKDMAELEISEGLEKGGQKEPAVQPGERKGREESEFKRMLAGPYGKTDNEREVSISGGVMQQIQKRAWKENALSDDTETGYEMRKAELADELKEKLAAVREDILHYDGVMRELSKGIPPRMLSIYTPFQAAKAEYDFAVSRYVSLGGAAGEGEFVTKGVSGLERILTRREFTRSSAMKSALVNAQLGRSAVVGDIFRKEGKEERSESYCRAVRHLAGYAYVADRTLGRAHVFFADILSRHFMGIDVNLTREREDAVPDMERLDKNGKETDMGDKGDDGIPDYGVPDMDGGRAGVSAPDMAEDTADISTPETQGVLADAKDTGEKELAEDDAGSGAAGYDVAAGEEKLLDTGVEKEEEELPEEELPEEKLPEEAAGMAVLDDRREAAGEVSSGDGDIEGTRKEKRDAVRSVEGIVEDTASDDEVSDRHQADAATERRETEEKKGKEEDREESADAGEEKEDAGEKKETVGEEKEDVGGREEKEELPEEMEEEKGILKEISDAIGQVVQGEEELDDVIDRIGECAAEEGIGRDEVINAVVDGIVKTIAEGEEFPFQEIADIGFELRGIFDDGEFFGEIEESLSERGVHSEELDIITGLIGENLNDDDLKRLPDESGEYEYGDGAVAVFDGDGVHDGFSGQDACFEPEYDKVESCMQEILFEKADWVPAHEIAIDTDSMDIFEPETMQWEDKDFQEELQPFQGNWQEELTEYGLE